MLRLLLRLFSSIRFGVVLLVLLFVYSSVGSAGILYPTSLNVFDLDGWAQLVPRQWRGLEMTEFEWFHWWPFDVLIGLICLNITVATLRRIAFKPVNYGVWMIHAGILILCAASAWYFSAKVEGDAPLTRRNVVVTIPGFEPVTLAAMPGSSITVGDGGNQHTIAVESIDPAWELLTGEHVGTTVYAVTVRFTTPQRTFFRQLLDGHPEFTEDVIPGQGRAVKVTGKPLVDESIAASLELAPQPYFYLAQSAALYVREVGKPEWIERPIDWLPRYNDTIASLEETWPVLMANDLPRVESLNIAVPPVSPDDPLPSITLNVGSYLRYAFEQTRQIPGGSALNPYLRATVTFPGGSEHLELSPRDPLRANVQGGIVTSHWITSEAELESLKRHAGGTVTMRVPDRDVTLEIPLREATFDTDGSGPFTPIEGTSFGYRLVGVRDHFQASAQGGIVSVAVIDFSTQEGTFRRWVFDRPAFNRDLEMSDDNGEPRERVNDPRIQTTYTPAAIVSFIAGPRDDELRVLTSDRATGSPRLVDAPVGAAIPLGADTSVSIHQFTARPREETRPFIVPKAERDRDADMRLRMIRLELPGRDRPVSIWLPFHDYPFASEQTALHRFPYRPKRVRLSDGRELEIVFSRRRALLPHPAVLADFNVDYHVGGFSGDNMSVENWTSVVRFATGEGLSEPHYAAVNAPAEHDGYWFFQSMWDPPDPPVSSGLNYTVLGVANREGVGMQLLGCAIAVTGMLYAFYVKPIIKRRRRDEVQRSLQEPRGMIPTARHRVELTLPAMKEAR